MRILNRSRNTVIAEVVKVADSFGSRMTGLLKHRSLPAGTGLLITHCNSIHMFFMKFAIDVIFADGNDRVVGVVRAIRPFRLSPIFWKARYVIELPVGTIDGSKTSAGDQLMLERQAP